MGQDMCSNVTCVNQCYVVEPTLLQKLEESNKTPTNRLPEPSQSNALSRIEENIQQSSSLKQERNVQVGGRVQEREAQAPEKLSEGQIIISNGFNIKKQLENLKQLFNKKNPRAIYLSIDKTWENEMRLQNQNLNDSYTLRESNGHKVTYERYGNLGSKYQILFRQHFPIFGNFYFQIKIQSYHKKMGCEFYIGVVNHLEASLQKHSKDRDYEQSFPFKANPSEAKQHQIVWADTKLKLQINRQNKQIIYYVKYKQDEKYKLQKQQKLKETLTDQVASLAPYIQTQRTGVVFSWEKPVLASTRSYKMSTILEQSSSNITA